MDDLTNHQPLARRLARRRALSGAVAGAGAAAFLAACGGGGDKETTKATAAPQSTQASAPAASNQAAASGNATSQKEWEDVVAAAKKEGKFSINLYPGEGYQRVLRAFQTAYPEIKVDNTTLRPVDFAPRVTQERKANVFSWDISIIPTSTSLQVLKPEGAWDPIKPLIIRPELKDDKVWNGGYEAGFLDKGKELTYAFTSARADGIHINTDMVKDDEVKSVRDLLQPKWKGKVVVADPRVAGAGFWPFTIARQKLGDEVMKQFFADQEPTILRERNQITEFMVRGRFPISIGVDVQVLAGFLKQGLGKNLKTVSIPEFDYQSSGTTLWLLNKAPHPNAAKVFVNWLLSKEGQTLWAKEIEANSRRLDIEPGDPSSVVPAGLKLTQIDNEDYLLEVAKTVDLAKTVIK